MKLSISLYHLLAIIALTLVLISLFFSNETIDIHLDDTYYVITLAAVSYILAFLLLFLWLLYRLTNKLLLSQSMSRVHIAMTTIISVLVITIPFWYDTIHTPGKTNSRLYFEQIKIANSAIIILILALIAGQIIFFINLFGGLLKKVKKQ